MDIGRNGADLRVSQTIFPWGHHTKAAVGDRFSQSLFTATIKPDRIRQVWRTLRDVSFAILAVARCTVILKHNLARLRRRIIILRQ